MVSKKKFKFDAQSNWSWTERPVIYTISELDRHLRSFVPALFSTIKIIDDKKVIVEVPHRAVPKIVEYLSLHYRCVVPLEVIGV